MTTGTLQNQNSKRRLAVHTFRVLLFCSIIGLIHAQHLKRTRHSQASGLAFKISAEVLEEFYPPTARLAGETAEDGKRAIVDSDKNPLGYVIQTSPQSDHIVGFSGPTDLLLAFDLDHRILGITILSSRDTHEHIRAIVEQKQFLHSFNRLSWNEAAKQGRVDAVSGATLTSLAIAESITHRLGGHQPSLRFPHDLQPADVIGLFPNASRLVPDKNQLPLFNVISQQGKTLGTLLRTSPSADQTIGYQGPTDTVIGFNPAGKLVGILVGKSFDNEPYVNYVRDDDYFLSLFNDMQMSQLAELNLEAAQIEGVSGATMTSMAVSRGIIVAAANQPAEGLLTIRDISTGSIVLVGLLIGFTSLRGHKAVRTIFRLLVIAYLGFINADFVSQALLVGWAQAGVPYQSAVGLVLLNLAAFSVPVFSKKNIYCSHLCPHGAVQQLLRNRLPWRLRLNRRFSHVLSLIPGLLLAWCLIVALLALPFSLVDIEPFDAYVWKLAGAATLAIAVVGLVVSLFVPMAYCRFGCPTGALLNYLRFRGNSEKLGLNDAFTVGFLLLTAGLYWGF